MIDLSSIERCPGCGNVIVRERGKVIGRNFCWPVEVDTNIPGYSYLKGVWGYCYTLSRHYSLTEPVFFDLTYARR